ncbi:sigma-70 family RNA polymerase sigma factor [Streptomyces sp. SID11385]|uniref:sigma-70 family RNA polymerase sigma factor n=1 Tax=Streptomyces sp. SID11385 TaxID=2706031 RepID=UPI0013C9AD35|nr:sigma-70 family RNA polymerase sigma factor [Streptomyces sp. SID11385]
MEPTAERDQEFTEFVRAHRAGLVRLAVLLLSGDQGRAEDVVQTALTRLYLAWPRVRGANLDAYGRRCVVNAAIDDRRTVFRRREQVHAQVPDTAGPEQPYTDYADLLALLGCLSTRMRAAVVLRYVEGLDVAAAAQVLGCSQGTVRSQSTRGLVRLRKMLPQPANTSH